MRGAMLLIRRCVHLSALPFQVTDCSISDKLSSPLLAWHNMLYLRNTLNFYDKSPNSSPGLGIYSEITRVTVDDLKYKLIAHSSITIKKWQITQIALCSANARTIEIGHEYIRILTVV